MAFPILCFVGKNTQAMVKESHKLTLDSASRKTFLDRLKGVQEKIRTLQADFQEERRISSLKTPLCFEGQIYYQSKNLFFMAYKKPFNYILRIQGKEALFYVEGSKTADFVDLSNVSDIAKHPNLFVWDPSQFKGEIWEDTQGFYLEETPQKGNKNYLSRRLTVLLDPKTLLVKQIEIQDAPGDLTVISVFNMQVNHELPLSVTRFTLPEGVKINRLNQP